MMKKVILLLILQLTVLMAADFTMSKSGTLTKEGATTPPVTQEVVTPVATEPAAPVATDPVTTVPASQSGVIPDSVDQIWADMHGTNTGWVSNMSSGFPQFQGPVVRNITSMTDWDTVNIWLEVEAGGNGSSCSADTNRAVNTRVEVGWTRGWLLVNNKWQKMSENKTVTGGTFPKGNTLFSGRGCDSTGFSNIQAANLAYLVNKTESSSGFFSMKPKYYFRFHGWTTPNNVPERSTVQAIYGQVYMRLIVEDPSKPDDRNLANYVAHLSSDRRLNNVYRGDMGMSRYKKITNDWVAINFLTSMTREALEANPPPFSLIP